MLDDHLRFFGTLCLTSETLGSAIVHWDSKIEKMIPAKNFEKRLRNNKIKCNIMLSLNLLLVLDFVFNKSSSIDSWDKTIFVLTVVVNLGAFSCTQALQKGAGATCLLVNGLLAYSRKWKHARSESKLSWFEFLCLHLTYATYLTLVLMPFLMAFGVHWMNPCKPAVIGHWLISECRNKEGCTPNMNSIYFVVQKLVVIFLNYLIWAFGCNGWVLGCPGLMQLSSFSLQNGLKL